MNSWQDYINQARSIDIYAMLDEIFSISRVQDEVIRLNQEQLQVGIDSQDKVIHTIGGRPYSIATIQIKRKKGQPTDVVTLKDTGDFYNSFRVKPIKQGYEIIADFRKGDEDIRDNLPGEFDVLGLTGESLAELVYETVLPRLTKMIRSELNV